LYRQAYGELVVLDTPVLVSYTNEGRVEIREVDDAKSYEDSIRLEIYTPAGTPEAIFARVVVKSVSHKCSHVGSLLT
jgi:hypothetical protein